MPVGDGAQPQLLKNKLDLNNLDQATERLAPCREPRCSSTRPSLLGAVELALLSGPDCARGRQAPGDGPRLWTL